MAEEPILSVHYIHEPDELKTFPNEGDRVTFGRDDDCDITIFSAINGAALSRIAGRIWRMENELWVRNLSDSHELWLKVHGRPAAPPLPPRDPNSHDPGSAQAIPGELAYILGPDGCVLVVTQHRPPPEVPSALRGEPTERMPELPDDLLPVARVLCAPLLRGSGLPASYGEVVVQLGLTMKRARTLVGRLTDLYHAEVPGLRERFETRQRWEEEQLALPANTQRRMKPGGVQEFATPNVDGLSDSDSRYRRTLTLPDYYEVAHLLVRRRVVTLDDLDGEVTAAG